MAKRHVDNTSLNRNTATRRSKFVSKTKTLPGSESVWEGRNESIVDRINGNMINAKFNKSVKSSKQRRPLPKTHVTNKDYFIIPEYGLDFYSIPEDKKGEKIKYLDKKSLNNFNNINLDKSNIDNVKYTIQLFSDVDINNVYKFLSNLKTIKKELNISDELFLFSFQTEIAE